MKYIKPIFVVKTLLCRGSPVYLEIPESLVSLEPRAGLVKTEMMGNKESPAFPDQLVCQANQELMDLQDQLDHL